MEFDRDPEPTRGLPYEEPHIPYLPLPGSSPQQPPSRKAPESKSASMKQRFPSGPLTRSSESFTRPPTSSKTKLWKTIRYLLLVFILLLGVGLLVVYVPRFLKLPRIQSPILLTITNTPWLDRSYTVAVPGPGCDAGGAQWLVGRYFKAPITPTASSATPQVQGTPTTQIISDNSTVTTCQQNGLLVTHNEHFATHAEIIFESNGMVLPRHFRTQITATFVVATEGAYFELGVRKQSGRPGIGQDNGYGDDQLEVGVDGSWKATRTNDTTDQMDAPFSRGFIQPAKSFTLRAEVDGPLMMFSINGQKVTTVVDTTYANGYGIDLGSAILVQRVPPACSFRILSIPHCQIQT